MSVSAFVKSAIALFVLADLLASTGAVAQTSYVEQKTACMGDALRLCARAIPDQERIIACLSAQHAQLSAGCVGVFDANIRALRQRNQ